MCFFKGNYTFHNYALSALVKRHFNSKKLSKIMLDGNSFETRQAAICFPLLNVDKLLSLLKTKLNIKEF